MVRSGGNGGGVVPFLNSTSFQPPLPPSHPLHPSLSVQRQLTSPPLASFQQQQQLQQRRAVLLQVSFFDVPSPVQSFLFFKFYVQIKISS